MCWERWAITINLAQSQTDQGMVHWKGRMVDNGMNQCTFLVERQRSLRSVEHQLSQCLLDILRCANDHKEHIPSIKTTEGNPFPYHVSNGYGYKQTCWSFCYYSIDCHPYSIRILGCNDKAIIGDGCSWDYRYRNGFNKCTYITYDRAKSATRRYRWYNSWYGSTHIRKQQQQWSPKSIRKNKS